MPTNILTSILETERINIANGIEKSYDLSLEEIEYLKKIIEYSESAKGVLTVVITSAIYKIYKPEQDIRYHQANMTNGYSGRSFDTANITPFMKTQRFPAMAESGWLTRSLEQNLPYDFNYKGSIRPEALKKAFLNTIDIIQNNKAYEVASYIINNLIVKRDAQQINLSRPINKTISEIINMLEIHFNYRYCADGAARLPVLAIYSIYQCLMNEIKRFEDKTLLALESHTSADLRSKRIGDIDVMNNTLCYEAVEVKHGITITPQLIRDAYDKFCSTTVERYYLLSTSEFLITDEITNEIEYVKRQHGCQVVVNGVLHTIKYYLRLLNKTEEFIANYVSLLEVDNGIKYEHKKLWNDIVAGIAN